MNARNGSVGSRTAAAARALSFGSFRFSHSRYLLGISPQVPFSCIAGFIFSGVHHRLTTLSPSHSRGYNSYWHLQRLTNPTATTLPPIWIHFCK